ITNHNNEKECQNAPNQPSAPPPPGCRNPGSPTRRWPGFVHGSRTRGAGYMSGAGTCRSSSRFGVSFEPLEIAPKIRSRLIAEVTILLQELFYDLLQLGRKRWIQLHNWNGIKLKNRVEHDCGGRSRKGHFSGRHLVEHDAEREQIRARIQFFSASLFGR